ncbi:MAG: hypothetical protein ACYTHN_17700, partial [Planctomycetota bacterium]
MHSGWRGGCHKKSSGPKPEVQGFAHHVWCRSRPHLLGGARPVPGEVPESVLTGASGEGGPPAISKIAT